MMPAMADFWTYLLDHDNKQRDDIDANADAVSAIADAAEQATRKATKLERQVDALQTMVMTLVELLAQTGQVDEPTWRATVEARLRAPKVVAVPAPVDGPRPYVCIRCEKVVLPQNTTMTAKGVVCDRWCV